MPRAEILVQAPFAPATGWLSASGSCGGPTCVLRVAIEERFVPNFHVPTSGRSKPTPSTCVHCSMSPTRTPVLDFLDDPVSAAAASSDYELLLLALRRPHRRRTPGDSACRGAGERVIGRLGRRPACA